MDLLFFLMLMSHFVPSADSRDEGCFDVDRGLDWKGKQARNTNVRVPIVSPWTLWYQSLLNGVNLWFLYSLYYSQFLQRKDCVSAIGYLTEMKGSDLCELYHLEEQAFIFHFLLFSTFVCHTLRCKLMVGKRMLTKGLPVMEGRGFPFLWPHCLYMHRHRVTLLASGPTHYFLWVS